MLSFQLWKQCRTFSLACLLLGFCELFWKFSNRLTALTGTKEGFVTDQYLVSSCTASHHSQSTQFLSHKVCFVDTPQMVDKGQRPRKSNSDELCEFRI